MSFLSKPYGGLAVFELDKSIAGYTYKTYEPLPIDQYNQIIVTDLQNTIKSYYTNKDEVEVFVVKPNGRKTDDRTTLFKVGYNTATVRAVLDLLKLKVYNIKTPILWQNHFNIDQTNTKQAALHKAKELLFDTPIESTEQAEAILIGVYGIETVIKKKILTKSIEYYKSIPANALIDFSVMD